MPDQEVVIKKVEPLQVATVRAVVPTYSHVGRLFNELFACLGEQKARPVGPALAIYYDKQYKERDADVEAAVPIAEEIVAAGRIKERQLPAVDSMACLVHEGPYETLHDAYATLMKWIEANGYRVAGPNREVYLSRPSSECASAPCITEVQMPVEKA